MRIKVGDLVKVISGSEKIRGTTAKVVSVNVKGQRVVLEGGLMHKKHVKPERSRKHPEGGIVEIPASIHLSNVMLMSESSGRPVRVGYDMKDGKKVRVARGKGASSGAL
jgi:large subunit ribosomal protein L24